jgi:hypothetical protein
MQQTNAHYYREQPPAGIPGQVNSPLKPESDSEMFVSQSSGDLHHKRTLPSNVDPNRRASQQFQIQLTETQNKSGANSNSKEDKKSSKKSSRRTSKIEEVADESDRGENQSGNDDQKSAASSSGQPSQVDEKAALQPEKPALDWEKINKGRRGQLMSRADMLIRKAQRDKKYNYHSTAKCRIASIQHRKPQKWRPSSVKYTPSS